MAGIDWVPGSIDWTPDSVSYYDIPDAVLEWQKKYGRQHKGQQETDDGTHSDSASTSPPPTDANRVNA